MKKFDYEHSSEKTRRLLAAESADLLFDLYAMQCALRLAARGAGQVSPTSPLVGCLIVSSAGAVVGEGFYVEANRKHAEIVALEAAGERARGAIVYIKLEPHQHFARTARLAPTRLLKPESGAWSRRCSTRTRSSRATEFAFCAKTKSKPKSVCSNNRRKR